MEKPRTYNVFIIEKDGTVMERSYYSRKAALEYTYAAEKVRNCKFWKITYIKPIY